MKKSHNRYVAAVLICLALPIFSGLSLAQEETGSSAWQLWLGSRYTGYDDFYKKIGEYERGRKGVFPELALDYSAFHGKNSMDVSGRYQDPWRFDVTARGQSKGIFSASLTYRSFYRQKEMDLLENLMAREAVDQANTPGGKMFTYEHDDPDADFGYTRREVTSHYQVKVPGSAHVTFHADHRAILVEGVDQKVISMHCSSCHMASKCVKVDQQTHTVSAGVEVDPGPLTFSYEGSYRQFRSEVPTEQAFYDTAQHPVNGGMVEDFGSRTVFNGEVVEFGKIPDTEKMAHTARLKADVGSRGQVYGSFTHSRGKNSSSDLETTGNSGNLKYVFRPNPRTRLLASASMARVDADEVFIDLPLWREGMTGGGQDFDWTRYSSLSRTVAKGSAEGTYQAGRALRLTASAAYEEAKRDDYPYFEADWKTTKMTLSASGRYRPGRTFSGRLKYTFRNIDTPFSTYNQFFEKAGSGEMTLLQDNSWYYYFQRDALRYGSLTNQPSMIHGVNASCTFRPHRKATFSAGLKAELGTNSDTDSLDYERTLVQPTFSVSLSPAPNWNFFSNIGYYYNTSNGLAAVAMMDG